MILVKMHADVGLEAWFWVALTCLKQL